MDSVIEIQRSHHEERERIIAAIVVENMEKKTLIIGFQFAKLITFRQVGMSQQ